MFDVDLQISHKIHVAFDYLIFIRIFFSFAFFFESTKRRIFDRNSCKAISTGGTIHINDNNIVENAFQISNARSILFRFIASSIWECNVRWMQRLFFYSRSSSSQFLSFSLSLIVNNSSPAVSTLSFLCLSFLCLSIQNASFSFKMLPVLCTMPTSVDTIPSYCTNCRDNNRNALDYSGWYCHCKLYWSDIDVHISSV